MNALSKLRPDSIDVSRARGENNGATPVDATRALRSASRMARAGRMSAIESGEGADSERAPTRRALAKQQTRARVLAAARQLFSLHGYDGATIRDIAAEANMSTGAVFANFADKYDLFREILALEATEAMRVMRAAAEGGAAVEDVLLRMFDASYRQYHDQLPLVRAAFSVASSLQGQVMTDPEQSFGFFGIFREPLDAALARGELRADTNVQLLAEMLTEAYIANMLRMLYCGASVAAVVERVRAQISVLLSGVQSA
jgi:AcrR family transcriptional regulator